MSVAITLLRRLWAELRRHEILLWWLHSAWALGCGVFFMWLGRRHFQWLRIAFVYIAFIWVTSLGLPRLVAHPRLSARHRAWLRTIVNYFNKNFYQQLLFFVLPIYAASTTWGAPNSVFVLLVALSAVLSTFDVVYDRHLSASRDLTAVFFAFNLFVCANVTLPILWSVSNHQAMRVSGALALAGFLTLRFHPRDLARRRVRVALVVSAAILAFFIEWARPVVPPAPLRLVSTQFGLGIQRRPPAVVRPIAEVATAFEGRVYGLSAIAAPLGLKDRVRHRWTQGARELHRSPYYEVEGGRREGYRLWTSARARTLEPGAPIELWVETEGGQLIGRARLLVSAGPP